MTLPLVSAIEQHNDHAPRASQSLKIPCAIAADLAKIEKPIRLPECVGG
jgi:hypothetical protein